MHYNGDFLSLPHLEESHWVIQWWKFICVMKRMNNTNGKKMENFLHQTGNNTCKHTNTHCHTHTHNHTHVRVTHSHPLTPSHTHAPTPTHTVIHSHAHTHTYTHTHTLSQ